MKRHLPMLFGLFLLFCISAFAAPSSALLTGCGTLAGTPDGSPVDWPDVAKCGPSVPDLVATVSRVLLGAGGPTDRQMPDRAHAELEDLARQHGPDTVACLVDLLVRQWTSPGAAQSPDRAGAAARGTDFLDDVGTRVDDNPAFEPPPEASLTEPILQFFAYAHLPEHLQAVSRPFGQLAEVIVAQLPRNPERTVALRKLLESKDAAVRAQLFKEA